MSVYVDKGKYSFRGMQMCHLIADDIHELHEFAKKIGLKRAWFQHSVSLPHYDISQSKRQLALQNGAIEINNLKVFELIRRQRRRGRDAI